MPGATTIAAVLGLAAFSTALAYIVFFRISATAGPSNVMLVTLLIPVSATALGALVLGERLAAHQIAGALVIASALAVIDGRLLGWIVRRVRAARALDERAYAAEAAFVHDSPRRRGIASTARVALMTRRMLLLRAPVRARAVHGSIASLAMASDLRPCVSPPVTTSGRRGHVHHEQPPSTTIGARSDRVCSRRVHDGGPMHAVRYAIRDHRTGWDSGADRIRR